MDAVFDGYDIKAVKIGLLPYPEVVSTVADCLDKRKKLKIVTDPVFSATSGKDFVNSGVLDLYKERIFPLSSLITPNINELSILSGKKILNVNSMTEAAKELNKETGVPILAKGGHLKKMAVDVLIDNEFERRFESKIFSGINSHGSGCILSAAICANIAKGNGIERSVEISKNFIKKLLNNGRNIKKTGNILDPLSDYFK
jgi:hydroxymethylpyrimidine/phosphomethylpyrimidine kinase